MSVNRRIKKMMGLLRPGARRWWWLLRGVPQRWPLGLMPGWCRRGCWAGQGNPDAGLLILAPLGLVGAGGDLRRAGGAAVAGAFLPAACGRPATTGWR